MYVKFYNSRFVFFVVLEAVKSVLNARVEGDWSSMTLTRFSDLVIDVEMDEIVKCRYPKSDIIDGRFTNIVASIQLSENEKCIR